MFKNLKIYYFFVSLPFVLLLVGAAAFFNGIKYTILRNPHPQINYTIFAIILIGGVLILLNARRLINEAKKQVEFFGAHRARPPIASLQKLANGYTGETACLLQMVATSTGRAISHQEQVAIEHELTNTRASLLRRNALPQYLTGLLVGMGLLGTFIGLLATLNDITVLISSFADLDMQNASPLLVFRTMIDRMRAPMQSMGIAFSASMFGLLGSIILGLMMVGLRRLQGDMFSLLSSEVARHIEIALSHDSLPMQSSEVESGAVGKALIRIEERYAEAARSQQRSLTALMDDLQKQRVDMLRALTEQTEANNAFRGEVQQLGRQLGGIQQALEKGNGEMASQLSDLTVHLTGDNRESHKLLALQVEEQRRLLGALDSYKIEERLAEVARIQQRALASVLSDFEQQRVDMLRALTEQTEANNGMRGELRQVGGQLGAMSGIIEKGNDRISGQISELTVLTSADAKEGQRLLETVGGNLREDLEQLGERLGGGIDLMAKGHDGFRAGMSDLLAHSQAAAKASQDQIEKTGTNLRADLQRLAGDLAKVVEKGDSGIAARIAELLAKLESASKGANEQLDKVGAVLRGELQRIGSQLDTGTKVMEKGTGGISAKIAELLAHAASDARAAQSQLEKASTSLLGELQLLAGRLDGGFNAIGKGQQEICTGIADLQAHTAAGVKVSQDLVGSASDSFSSGLQQLGVQLDSIFSVMEKGNGKATHPVQEPNPPMVEGSKGPRA